MSNKDWDGKPLGAPRRRSLFRRHEPELPVAWTGSQWCNMLAQWMEKKKAERDSVVRVELEHELEEAKNKIAELEEVQARLLEERLRGERDEPFA